MRTRLITVPITTLAICFGACGPSQSSNGQGRYDVDPGTEPTVDPTAEPTVDPIDVGAQVWCPPTAVSYDIADIPTPPDNFEASSFCAAESLSPPGDFRGSTVWAYDPALQVLEVRGGPMLGRLGTQVFTLDDDGNAREVHAYGPDVYSPSRGETWYTLDADGEMVHTVAVWIPFEGADEDQWFVTESDQTWVDGVLTRFTEDDGNGGPLTRDTTWQYNADGQLTIATATNRSDPDVTRVYEAAWTYHDDGQPASVERAIDGVVVVRETWTFDGVELVSRTHHGISRRELQAQTGGTVIDWQLSPPLDSYQRRGDPWFSEDPWTSSVPVASSEGDCQILPRGPGHGYPQAESEHHLGVDVTERPAGIAAAYGNVDYRWYRGDLGWYGHHGLGSHWIGDYGTSGAAVSVFDAEVFYEDGRMVREIGSFSHLANTFTYTRQRAVDAGFIASDRATFEHDQQSVERTLEFTRDDDGNIVSRSLMNGDLVVETQRTAYDVSGHIVAHSIEPAAQNAVAEPDPMEGRFAGFGSYTPGAAAWSWTYEEDRIVERTGPGLRQTLRYDERGNTIASEGSFLALPPTRGSLTWTYNDLGQETGSCSWSVDGEPNWCTRTVYDTSARVAWHEVTNTFGELSVNKAYDYICVQ